MDKQISIRLPDDLLDRMDRVAAELRIRRSDLVRRAIIAYVEDGILGPGEKPLDRVRDLIGSVRGAPPDLGRRHREYLKDLIVDRRG